jgi:hypothetical protein
MNQHRITKVLKTILFVLLMAVLLGFIVKTLWNSLLPPLFGWHLITFWQALGLLVLSKIFFAGFHPRGGGGRNRWNRGMKERWDNMTPEERDKFRKGMRCHRGPFGRHAESQHPEPQI